MHVCLAEVKVQSRIFQGKGMVRMEHELALKAHWNDAAFIPGLFTVCLVIRPIYRKNTAGIYFA